MGDYTPTTDSVRSDFITGADRGAGRDYHGRAFDRWLAQHDREVTAKALREAATAVQAYSKHPYSEAHYAADELRERADRIEEARDAGE